MKDQYLRHIKHSQHSTNHFWSFPKWTIQVENGQKIWTDISLKRIYRWVSTWNDVPHHKPLGDTLKQQGDITTYPSQGLKQENSDNAETRRRWGEIGSSYRVGRNVRWYRKFCHFPIKLNMHLPHNLAIALLGVYPRKIKNLSSQKNLYMDVHSPNWKQSDHLQPGNG